MGSIPEPCSTHQHIWPQICGHEGGLSALVAGKKILTSRILQGMESRNTSTPPLFDSTVLPQKLAVPDQVLNQLPPLPPHSLSPLHESPTRWARLWVGQAPGAWLEGRRRSSREEDGREAARAAGDPNGKIPGKNQKKIGYL